MSTPDLIATAEAAGFERIVGAGEDWVCFTDDIKKLCALVAEDCAQIAEKAEPYQSHDLIRSKWCKGLA
jgi:hypothetical protein